MKVSQQKPANKYIKPAAIAVCFALPAVYITKFHVDMFDKKDKPNRQMMLNSMVGFFIGVGASVLGAHKKLSKNKDLNLGLKIAIAAIAPIAGLKIAKQINKNQYPERFQHR
jgi:hypothetical protein